MAKKNKKTKKTKEKKYFVPQAGKALNQEEINNLFVSKK